MAPASAPLQVSIACWFVLEIVLLVRDVARRRAHRGGDRGTRVVVAVSLGFAVVFAWRLRSSLPALDTPGFFAIAGPVVVALGLALRVWAVVSLGTAFSTFVQVADDQQVVTRGPYRWVRHPSYTGLLLIVAGLGVGMTNWLSVVICCGVPLLGLLPRIRVEEAELVRVLGEPYRDYQRRTRRLVPGVW